MRSSADEPVGPLKQLLVERRKPIPFFLEETVRTLVETKALAGERGAYRLAQSVQSRSRSPPPCRPSWPRASTGWRPRTNACSRRPRSSARTCRSPLLLAIADAPEEALRRGIAHLQAAEFLYETRLFPDLEYTFKHALTHEVAYGGLLHERRRDLHARIVEVLERRSRDRVAEQVERLAHHALRGELGEKAVAYLRQAGLRAARVAYPRPRPTWSRRSELSADLPETGRRPRGPSTSASTCERAHPLGDRARMGAHLHETEVLARTLGDQHRLASDRHLHGDPGPGHGRLRRGRQIRAGGPGDRANPPRARDPRWSPRPIWA